VKLRRDRMLMVICVKRAIAYLFLKAPLAF
jgi:hypothetical protein